MDETKTFIILKYGSMFNANFEMHRVLIEPYFASDRMTDEDMKFIQDYYDNPK